MAKLSLATNASRDQGPPRSRQVRHEDREDETRAVLQEVIDAAETFEFGRVRKDAMAAIEQLKTKGPASTRNTMWWGTVWPDRPGDRLRGSQRHGPGRRRHPLRRRRRGPAAPHCASCSRTEHLRSGHRSVARARNQAIAAGTTEHDRKDGKLGQKGHAG